MLAAITGAGLLQSVPDDADAAMIAGRRERMNGTLETIERMRLAIHCDLKGLVIVVAARFTCSHDIRLRCDAA